MIIKQFEYFTETEKMGHSDTIPAWKRDILVRRKHSQSFQRSTDVLDIRDHQPPPPSLEAEALKSPIKTADIIKFFNSRSDGDTAANTRETSQCEFESHLADKSGNI